MNVPPVPKRAATMPEVAGQESAMLADSAGNDDDDDVVPMGEEEDVTAASSVGALRGDLPKAPLRHGNLRRLLSHAPQYGGLKRVF